MTIGSTPRSPGGPIAATTHLGVSGGDRALPLVAEPRCTTCSPASYVIASFAVENHCARPVQLIWRTFDGGGRTYATIAPGAVRLQSSYVGHRWEIVDEDGTLVRGYVVLDEGDVVSVCG